MDNKNATFEPQSGLTKILLDTTINFFWKFVEHTRFICLSVFQSQIEDLASLHKFIRVSNSQILVIFTDFWSPVLRPAMIFGDLWSNLGTDCRSIQFYISLQKSTNLSQSKNILNNAKLQIFVDFWLLYSGLQKSTNLFWFKFEDMLRLV